MDIEGERELTIEKKIAVVDGWIGSFSRYDEGGDVEIREMDTGLLKDVLTEFGADFEPKPKLVRLKQKTNLHRRAGMNAVWGEQFMDDYNRWTVKWANEYEERTDKQLPRLKKSKNRTSGMRHFLGHLTAYAADQISFQIFESRMEARLTNGWRSSKGFQKREYDFLPDGKKFPGSIPPGFVDNAWEYVKSWKV